MKREFQRRLDRAERDIRAFVASIERTEREARSISEAGRAMASIPTAPRAPHPTGCGCCGFKLGDTITISCAGCDPASHVAFRPIPYFQCAGTGNGAVARFAAAFGSQSVEVELQCNPDGSVAPTWIRQCCFGGTNDNRYSPLYPCTPATASPSCDPLLIVIPELWVNRYPTPPQCVTLSSPWVITR